MQETDLSKLPAPEKEWPKNALVATFYFVASLIMTYPLMFRLGGEWLATYDPDTYVKLWDIWWLRKVLQEGQSLMYTSYLFFPEGVDLSFHSISYVAAGLAVLFTAITDTITAYNLTIFLAVFTAALSGYWMAREVQLSRPAAWLAGAIYAFAPYHMAHSGGHPDLAFLAPIPIALIFIRRALLKGSYRYAFYGALMVFVAALTSLYILNLLFFTLLSLFVFWAFSERRWQNGRFWKTGLVFGFLTTSLVSLRLWPILTNLSGLSQAIEQKYVADATQTDLLAFVTPSHFNPFFEPYVKEIVESFEMNQKWPAYLGFVPLVLVMIGLIRRKNWREYVPWLTTAILFFLLALGPILRVNGQTYENLKLLYAYLDWFPPIRTIGRPDFFVLGLLLPFAICAAIGLEKARFLLIGQSFLRSTITLLIIFTVMFEYWNGPYNGVTLSQEPFYELLAASAYPTALIDLPMGRQLSKLYLFYQTIHEKPIVEGLVARTPVTAYAYIQQNLLLSLWYRNEPLDCHIFNSDDYRSALEELLADGIEYVILHRTYRVQLAPDLLAQFTAEPVYADTEKQVFTLEDMYQASPCE